MIGVMFESRARHVKEVAWNFNCDVDQTEQVVLLGRR
jgi:hypothetical protein